MFKLRFWFAFLALWLLLFYNIERINEPINITSFVYVLAPVSIAILMAAPRLFAGTRIVILIIPVLGLYFGLKVALGYTVFDSALAITVTEVVSLLIGLFLARPLASVALDFEDTIAKLTLRQIGLPPRLFETVDTEDMYREVKRSRRFQHPLVLLSVEPVLKPGEVELNRILLDLQKTMITRYIQARVAKLLSEDLRDVDMIAQHGDGFVVLMPETKADEARDYIAVLQAGAAAELQMDLKIGMASFPETALTLGGLLEAATENLEEQHGPEGTNTSGKGDKLGGHSLYFNPETNS